MSCLVFTATPFLLGVTIRHHLLKYDKKDPEFVHLMLESFVR